MTAKQPTRWTVGADGRLDSAAMARIDEIAGEFVDIVHGGGDSLDIARLVAGMGWPHLVGLAISIAALVTQEPKSSSLSLLHHGTYATTRRWVQQDLRAAYTRGFLAGQNSHADAGSSAHHASAARRAG